MDIEQGTFLNQSAVEIYVVASIIDYEGIYHMEIFSNKDDAEKIASDLREYDKIGQYVENTPEPKFWKELRGDDWVVIPRKINHIES